MFELKLMMAHEVSTGSGSDRVSIHATVESVENISRSLSLPVLTSSRRLKLEL
jgi:hypothetical protein